MANALLITLVGMGLVFLAILLLWGLMALLVRLTREPAEAACAAIAAVEAGVEASPPQPSAEQALLQEHTLLTQRTLLMQRKRRAAVAAVALALSLRKNSLSKNAPETPRASLSAWQAAHRAGQISQNTNTARKKGFR